MITRLVLLAFSRPALASYLLVLQLDHMRRVWIDYDPQIQTRLLCLNQKLSTAETIDEYGRSIQATSRRFRCAFNRSMVYVYLHFSWEYNALYTAEDRSWNVAFRYRGADPALAWSSNHRLQIAVDGSIEIDKQLITLHAVPIDYALTQINITQ